MNLCYLIIFFHIYRVSGDNSVPVIDPKMRVYPPTPGGGNFSLSLPSVLLSDDPARDTHDFWRETEILALVKASVKDGNHSSCRRSGSESGSLVRLVSTRKVKAKCRNKIELQLCPQCPHFNNYTECELFRDFCKERRVHASEYRHYCDRKYGPWRAMLVPADYTQCRCCDECVPYREQDQSCVNDEYNFDVDETLPVNTIDFRAGCNPYWGHPEQETRALRCDENLRRCVPVRTPSLPKEAYHLHTRRNFRYQVPSLEDCPVVCTNYQCPHDLVSEAECPKGAFLPNKDQCNCCGKCSGYQQLNDKCAEFKKTIHKVNGTEEIEVEEEFLDPGCDEGLVCREGRCQDIHVVPAPAFGRKSMRIAQVPYEPCKEEMKIFKKKYGADGHLHYDAPQCTPLWLYAQIQCRRFICYCALEDGTFIEGIKVPRVEVSNMNCDCAREQCRNGANLDCDGYGNYKTVKFTKLSDDWKKNGTVTAMSTTPAVLF